MVVRAGGYRQVNLFHLTESGISIDEPLKYIIYYIVVGLFFAFCQSSLDGVRDATLSAGWHRL